MGRLTILLLLLLCGAPALAAGGEEGPTQKELVWQAFNLALLLGVILYVSRKPIQRFFAERREQIQEEIETASDFLKDAETRHAEWQRKLADLETEVQRIRTDARARAQEESDKILADARVAADRIRSDATAAVDQELRRAQAELQREASELAVELAGNVLREQVTDADRDRLLDDFIDRVSQRSEESAR